MAADFKYIIVGRGMMGAAAARHLAKQTDGVAVIGPDEPEDRKNHTGVFASHYDEGRITRTIDQDADWARLANRSIARYAEIEQESGIQFYSETGCLLVGPKRGGSNPFVADVVDASQQLQARIDVLDGGGLKAKFPYFAFDQASEGVYEPRNAGHISPRRLVKAQSLLAEKAGATVIKDIVKSIRDEDGLVVVTTVEGKTYRAEKVLSAAGGFSITQNFLAEPVEMKVRGRTVVYFEISEEDAQAYAGMPSVITEDANPVDSIYLLPPIRYPDGKLYIKIGGDPDDFELDSDEALRAWFRTDGRPHVREHLTRIIRELIPDLKPLSISTASCVTSYSRSTYPMIAYTSSPRIAVMTGCAGTSAKSSDEIGRLGAELLFEGRIKDQGYKTDFAAYFRD
jgi:sarcosine oxidase